MKGDFGAIFWKKPWAIVQIIFQKSIHNVMNIPFISPLTLTITPALSDKENEKEQKLKINLNNNKPVCFNIHMVGL